MKQIALFELLELSIPTETSLGLAPFLCIYFPDFCGFEYYNVPTRLLAINHMNLCCQDLVTVRPCLLMVAQQDPTLYSGVESTVKSVLPHAHSCISSRFFLLTTVPAFWLLTLRYNSKLARTLQDPRKYVNSYMPPPLQ